MDPANREYLTSQAIRGIWIVGHRCSPDKRYWRIWTCLPGEVESSSSPIRRQASDAKYPKKVERRPDRISAVRYPKKVGRRPDIIPDVRYPGKVGRRPDRIPFGWNEREFRPDGMSENFRPGWMSDAMCRKGDVCLSKGEGATRHFLGRIPHWAGDFLAIIDAMISIKEIRSYSCPLVYNSCNKEHSQQFEIP